LKNCEGVCDGSETVAEYNDKVRLAIQSLGEEKPTYMIREKGRHFEEEAFVLVKEGRYQGFGFIESDVQINTIEDYEPFLRLQESTFHTNKIIHSYFRKYGQNSVTYFENEVCALEDEMDTQFMKV
jgi:DNA polymerase-3 subunit epsilon